MENIESSAISTSFESQVPNICFVHMDYVVDGKSDFATHVPIRTKELFANKMNLHLVYAGYIDEQKMKDVGIVCHQIKSPWAKVPIIAGLLLFIKLINVSRKYQITAFENIWSFRKMPILLMVARISKSKCVARIPGIVGIYKSSDNFIKRFLKVVYRFYEKSTLNLCDCVHVLSESLQKEYLSRGVLLSKMHTISQGVNTHKFAYNPKLADGDKFKLLIVSRIEPIKSIDTVIYALSSLIDNGRNNVELTIVGTGTDYTRLAQKIHELKIDKYVHFYGYINNFDIYKVYQNHDVLLLTSKMEGLPNVVLEAQASGIPVIGTKVGEMTSLLKNDRGVLVNPNDIKGVSNAITLLMDNDDLYKNIKLNSRKFVVKNHSYNQLEGLYLKMYTAV